MVKLDASDLHIKCNSTVHVRVGAVLRAVKEPPLESNVIEQMAFSLMTEEQQAYFHKYGSIDLAHELPESDRYRINIFRQRGEISLSIRRVTRNIPDFASLNLPPEIAGIVEADQGLILLAGPTGSGKSTTIASMIEHINTNRRCHIITIEDPIEYLYEDKKALISQREIGIDVPNFPTALRAMLREDPDIVLIGEMRDYETFEAAIQASETGHLVFGTIHASSAPQTISRVLELFPTESRDLILQSLAFSLRAIICQKLLPSVKEGVSRVPAVEILQMNPTVRNLLENGRDNELGDVIRSHEDQGMCSFTRSLYELIEKDMIDPKVAYTVAPNPEDLKMMIKGISQSQRGLVGRR
ncbi:MAG: PilT/PilU family type 4a pilus ATPase [Phycisphaerae bacterium]|nr:PilT/PilU family type 4a pilus ATPase [Phycisphaerae bacterium]